MSDEGDNMVFGEKSQENTDRETNRVLGLFQELEEWRDDEMWIADALEAIIQGKGKYCNLPASDSRMPDNIYESAEGVL